MWASAGGGECDELSWDRLAAATAAASSFFSAQLGARQGWAPGYLASRGIWPRIWRQWGLGYAPGGWTALTSYLRGLGFPDETTVAAGLAKRTAQGRLIDVFRNRVMFPVRTLDAIVAGFIGRAPPAPLSPPPSPSPSRRATPVYLNTGVTPLYHKGELLFGLYEARPALRAGAVPVLVEGPFDAIAVTACGRGRFAGIAPCGTALTVAQVSLLGAVADLDATGVLVAFDGDPPGRAAAVRAFPLLAGTAREAAAGGVGAAGPAVGPVSAVTLPDGQDPAGYLRDHGPGQLAEFLAGQQQPLADLVIDARIDEFARWLQYPEGIYNALRATAAAIGQLPPHEVARQVIRTARRLGVRHQEVTNALISAIEP